MCVCVLGGCFVPLSCSGVHWFLDVLVGFFFVGIRSGSLTEAETQESLLCSTMESLRLSWSGLDRSSMNLGHPRTEITEIMPHLPVAHLLASLQDLSSATKASLSSSAATGMGKGFGGFGKFGKFNAGKTVFPGKAVMQLPPRVSLQVRGAVATSSGEDPSESKIQSMEDPGSEELVVCLLCTPPFLVSGMPLSFLAR